MPPAPAVSYPGSKRRPDARCCMVFLHRERASRPPDCALKRFFDRFMIYPHPIASKVDAAFRRVQLEV
jgi:hypothetical protein